MQAKFYNFNMAVMVGIINKCDLIIEVHRRNQPNKSKLSLYNYKSLKYKAILSFKNVNIAIYVVFSNVF